jgi:hypothetical protein
MASDMDNFSPKQSALLEEAYDTADDAGKALLDTAFICLCGYSLKTLREQPEVDNTDGDDDDTEDAAPSPLNKE